MSHNAQNEQCKATTTNLHLVSNLRMCRAPTPFFHTPRSHAQRLHCYIKVHGGSGDW